MPGETDKEARFTLKVESLGASELDKLRGSVERSQAALKQHQATLNALRGTSAEVTSAKKALEQSIESEKDAIGRSNLALYRSGQSFTELVKAAKAAAAQAKERARLTQESAKREAAASKELKDAVGSVGGPAADASRKFRELSSVLEACANPTVALAVAGAGLVLAMAAIAAGVIAATVALSKFAIESGNALRAQGLAREAIAGSAEDAARMGRQLDFVAEKLATPRAKLNDLYVSIRKTFDGSRISGQGIVDTFQAVASASEAMGDDTGRALLGILERSKQFGRVQINPLELRGTGGPQFDEIAAALAKKTKQSVADARLALLTGRVPIDSAAAAIATAVETRFGQVNAKKLLDLNVLSVKLRENWANLTKGVNLQPILVALKSVVDLFSESTVTGAALQAMFTGLGALLGAGFKAAMPYVIWSFREALNLGLRFGIGMINVASAVLTFSRSTAGFITFRVLLYSLAGAFAYLGSIAIGTLASMAVAAFPVIWPFLAIGAAIFGLVTAISWLAKQDWTAIGGAIVNGIAAGLSAAWTTLTSTLPAMGAAIVSGIVSGLTSAWSSLTSSVSSMAEGVKGAFRKALGIASPSRVFAAYGQQTAAGYAQGVDRGGDEAEGAVRALVRPPAAPKSAGGVGASAGGDMVVNVTFNIQGGSAEQVAAAVRDPSVLGAVMHAIELAGRSLGIPTQAAVTG